MAGYDPDDAKARNLDLIFRSCAILNMKVVPLKDQPDSIHQA